MIILHCCHYITLLDFWKSPKILTYVKDDKLCQFNVFYMFLINFFPMKELKKWQKIFCRFKIAAIIHLQF